jgi:hypothetical protein
MRNGGMLCVSSLVVLAGCGGSSDGSKTVVVNYSQFNAAGVSRLSSHVSPPTASTGSILFVHGPGSPPIGVGSGEWRVGADGNSGEELRFDVLDGVLLSDVTKLSFFTYVQTDTSGIPVVSVNLSMRVDWNGDDVEDDRIFFEPEYQHAYTVNVPDQGDLLLGVWQAWDALAGGWWSNNDPSFGPGVGVRTLADYIAAHPAAAVVTHTDGSGGTRLNAGYGSPAWDNFVGNADAFEVGILGEVVTFNLDP